MNRVSSQQIREIISDIFSYREQGATLKQTIIKEIIELAEQQTPDSLAKLKRLKSLIESIFAGRDLGRRSKLDYSEGNKHILIRDMLDEDYLCYLYEGDSSNSNIVFLTCLKRFT